MIILSCRLNVYSEVEEVRGTSMSGGSQTNTELQQISMGIGKYYHIKANINGTVKEYIMELYKGP